MRPEQTFYYSLQEMYACTTHVYADKFKLFMYSFLCVSDVYITGIVQEVLSAVRTTHMILALCLCKRPCVCVCAQCEQLA